MGLAWHQVAGDVMGQLPNIFAAVDDEAIKLILMIVVGAIVGIGSLIQSAKKKQNEARQREQHQENWERIEQEMRERAARATAALSSGQMYQQPPPPPLTAHHSPQHVPPPPPPVFAPTRTIEGPYTPPPPQRRPAPPQPVAHAPRPVRANPPVVRAQPQPRRPKKQKPPRLPGQLPALPASSPAIADPPVSTRPVDAPPAPREHAANTTAAALSRWLTPQTLRSQFMLTEILQPPLALRDRDASGPASGV